jgi:frataxin-like iron-binding protein CyaY
MIAASAIKKFLDCNINAIGVGSDKRPSNGQWSKYIKEKVVPFDVAGVGFGLICGEISGNLEAIDIDLKHDDTGTLYDEYVSFVKDHDEELLDSLTIIQTPSGGYHWVYRCEEIEGNKKLARKLNKEVLVETRGEGGYIAFIPNKYKAVQGTFSTIPQITPKQRELLLIGARRFDQITEEVRIPKTTYASPRREGKTPWDHYNSENDCLEVLLEGGWTFVYEDSKRIYVKRPGDTSAAHSGNILKDLNLFRPYTSSTSFEAEKSYAPFAVYAVLNHDGDFSAAAKDLSAKGWGDRVAQKENNEEYRESTQKPAPKDIVEEDDYTKYLPDAEEDDVYLEAVRSGNLQRGKTTGSDALDKYFVFKDSAFIVVVGDSNVGKTTSLLYLNIIAAIVHKEVSVIVAMEDATGKIKRKIMEFYMMKRIENMTSVEYDDAKTFLDTYFILLKGRGGFIKTMPQLLNILYKISDDTKYHMVLVDPYSAFKKELTHGQNGHDYDYDIAGDILNFCDRTGARFILNTHTGTESRRKRATDDNGYKTAPFHEDAEGGGKWTNRADTVIVLHRKVDHIDVGIRTAMEFYVSKERDIETGGWITNRDEPVRFFLQKNMSEYLINGEASIVQRYKAKEVEDSKGEQSGIDWTEEVTAPF